MPEPRDYALGLDIGAASVGWALVALGAGRRPTSLLHAGVRIFSPGVEGDMAAGREESRAAGRREKRLQRRQLRRRGARQRDLFRLLQRAGLLPAAPAGVIGASERRHAVLNALDLTLRDRLLAAAAGAEERAEIQRALPYVLRRQALDRRLEPDELGRVLYHLIQRRGFLSNRRAERGGKKRDEELGQVKRGISELDGEIAAAGARTLGEYFSRLDPHQRRIRQRWTARRMFQREFAAIWARQAPEHPDLLTDELKAQLERLLFWQRPLRAQGHLIGRCELEPNHRRAPMWSWEGQQFRLLQKLNDLRVIPPGGTEGRALDAPARQRLLAKLEAEGDLTWAAARKAAGLAKGETFNLERGTGKGLPGNRTEAHMRRTFGPRWETMPAAGRREAIGDWAGTSDETDLVRLGRCRWGLNEDEARRWTEKNPEPDYSALSRQAIRRLLPDMTAGVPFKTAERDSYGPRFSGGEAKHRIPPVRKALGEVRNPAVARALTEVRKVVNAIVREFGKPFEVHIEMARDLKRSRPERQQAQKRQQALWKERERAARKILAERGQANPDAAALKRVSREDRERLLLAEECGWHCPYTDKPISMTALFDQSQFDVEHIIPYSRCPDDSFLNKTLCYHEENRLHKREQTPWEAYGGDAARWEDILNRVRGFGNAAKLRRFELKTLEEVEGFSARQLADTRYASKLAARLLGELYGGRDIEDQHKISARHVEEGAGAARRVIFASSGMATASLRKSWGLEAILRALAPGGEEGRGKPRGDHRHHAIDAIVVALTSAGAVQAMSAAAAAGAAWEGSVRAASRIPAPWPDFVDSVRPHFETMLVSHRPEHKLGGALHAETNYGPAPGGRVRVRQSVAGLTTAEEIGRIADAAVRAAVEKRAAAGPLKACATDGSWPMLPARNGEGVPIKKVRMGQKLAVMPVGAGARERFVAGADNHHVAIFARLGPDGREQEWEGMVVSRFEAARRRRRGDPVVCREYPEAGPEWIFKFSLMGGDTVALTRDGRERVHRVRTIAANQQLRLMPVEDGRLLREVGSSAGSRFFVSVLRRLGARKVAVDLLGGLHPAGG